MGHTYRAPLTPFRPDNPGRDNLTSMVSDPVSILWLPDQRSDRLFRKVYPALDVVYFVRGADAVKIGTTNQLVKRFADIQGQSPIKLTLFGLIYGDRSIEKWCHLRCFAHRKHYEWFYWNPWTEAFVGWLLGHGEHAAEDLGLTGRSDWTVPMPRCGSRTDGSRERYLGRENHRVAAGAEFGICRCERCADQPWERW